MFRNRKFLSIMAASGFFLSMNAVAQPGLIVLQPGFYLGGTIGFGDVRQNGFSYEDINNNSAAAVVFPPPAPGPNSNSVQSNGLAGRLFGGYQITQYIALELGFTRFSNLNVTTSNLSNTNFGTFGSDTTLLSGPFKTYAIDFLAKLMMPLGVEGVFAYATVGGAYMNQTVTVSVQNIIGNNLAAVDFVTPQFTTTTTAFLPSFGLGMSYMFSQAVTGDVTWNHIQNTGVKNLCNTDLWGIGMTYHIY